LWCGGGQAPHASGLGAPVETILTWSSPTGADKFFGAAGTSIFDVTASGAVGAAVASGFTSARWQYTNLSNTGGYWTVAVNGQDAPQKYDGTTWTASAITGVTGPGINALSQICQFKQRLWFAQKGTLDLYFLPLMAVEGAATVFPAGAVFRRGGEIVGLGSVSNDSGTGPQNLLCIVTSNGEIAVYQGIDPTDASTWGLAGLYDTGRPIGRRCVARLSGDMFVVTEDGVVSIQATFRFDRASDMRATITSKIRPLFNDYASQFGNNFGWQPIPYPASQYFVVNVPTVQDSQAAQFVMNTTTGSWCRFIGLDAVCWGVANDRLWFGKGNGTVYQADVGFDDDGSSINFELMTAWNAHGAAREKLSTAVRPIMMTGGNVYYAIGVDADFEAHPPTGLIMGTPFPGTSVWTMTWPWIWGGNNVLDAWWRSAGRTGTWASIHMTGQIKGGGCEINAFELVGMGGGFY
jgi:hypothetical protein